MEADEAPPTAAEVRAQLARIVEAPSFEASERNRRFLSYVVEETLAGNSNRIKAYSVATDVFGRDASFDPQLDPIVRIEASRLRRALEHYYLVAGVDDPVRIDIAKGSYVPSFSAAPRSEAPPKIDTAAGETGAAPFEGPAIRRAWGPRHLSYLAAAASVLFAAAALILSVDQRDTPDSRRSDPAAASSPTIYVAALDMEGDQSTFPGLPFSLRREITMRLARFSDLMVFGTGPTDSGVTDADMLRIAAENGMQIDYVLAGSVTQQPDSFRVTALLQDTRTGRFIWTGEFVGSLSVSEILRARDEVADRIARALAQPYGTIFQEEAREIEGQEAGSLKAYACVVQFYKFWNAREPEDFVTVKECLERTISEQPDYAEAFAALSFIHIDAHRLLLGDGPQDGAALRRAFEYAYQALKLAPESTRARHALSIAYWLDNDIERSLSIAREGLALNPNDTQLMSDLGARLVYRGEWDEGVPLLEEVAARSLAQPGSFRLGLALNHYRKGRYQEALDEARRLGIPSHLYGHMIVAMAAGRLGLEAETADAITRLEAIAPGFGGKVTAHLEARNIHPEIIAMIVDGLRNAGMDMGQEQL